MSRRFDFDDLRYLLAVAETGSTLAAARALRVSQSTVSRRIAALEEAVGILLFQKLRTGYQLTDQGKFLLGPASNVRSATQAFLHAVDDLSRNVSGTVRFTTNHLLAELVLPSLVSQMREKYRDVRVEVDTSSEMRDLAKGEADVALRSGQARSDAGLVGLRLAVDHWSLYCSRSYAERSGYPTSASELRDHALIRLDSSFSTRREFEWSRKHFPDSAVIIEQNSLPGAFASVRSGIGVGFYSDFLACIDDQLVRCFRPDLPPTLEIWLLTHERLRDVPRVRAVMDTVKLIVLRHKRQLLEINKASIITVE